MPSAAFGWPSLKAAMAVTFSTVHHTVFIVSDFERSVAFYSKLFGKEPTMRAEVQDYPQFDAFVQAQHAHALVAFFELANAAFEIIQFINPQESVEQVSVHRPGSKHFCLAVDDADAIYQALKAEGYNFISAPCHFSPAQGALDGIVAAYFLDPDGNVIEIVEDPKKKSLLGKIGLSNPEDN